MLDTPTLFVQILRSIWRATLTQKRGTDFFIHLFVEKRLVPVCRLAESLLTLRPFTPREKNSYTNVEEIPTTE